MNLAWFKTKLLSLFGLFLVSFLLVGCGSSGGGSSSSSNGNGSNGGGGNSDLKLTSFKFEYGVLNTTINATNVDITIKYDFGNQELKPTVTHTGVDYSPTGAIDFANLPQIYTIKASNGSTRGYSVIVRRAFTVSNTTELTNAIDTINGYITENTSLKYITILVQNNISLKGVDIRTINSTWAGNNITVVKDNSAISNNITITGLTVEGINTVEFIGVNSAPASNDNQLTGFTFPYGVIKNATISGTNVDITIDYNSTSLIPIVTHNGLYYYPNSTAIDFANIPATYWIRADDNTPKNYQVIVRRAIEVSNETALASTIDKITNDNLTYITILINKDINLTGANQRNITDSWKDRNITLEKYNSENNVTIKGLTIEADKIVTLEGVYANILLSITSFTFNQNVTKPATIDRDKNSIDITIDYNATFPFIPYPTVEHTGVDYSPKTAIDFASLPTNYTITAANSSTKTYSVIVRRAITVSTETELKNAIDTINANITNSNYITILINKDINLTGANNRTIPISWKGKNIILENNSNNNILTIKGLSFADNNTVGLIKVQRSSEKELTGFSFAGNVIKSATFSGTNVDITINYSAGNSLTPTLTHTGFDYSPKGAINLSNTPQTYRITAGDSSTKDYKVTTRRAIIVSSETELRSAIDTINGNIANNNYTTILITKDINLTGDNQRTIPDSWKNRNIILEKYNTAIQGNVTVRGITIEGSGTVGLVGVNTEKIIFVSKVAAGTYHSIALDDNGKIWAAGEKYSNKFQRVTIPDLPSNTNITSLSAGDGQTLALDSSGKIWASGNNQYGALGLGNYNNQTSFKAVTLGYISDAKIVSVSTGYQHSIALDDEGKIWVSGYNWNGELGLGDVGHKNIFQPVSISGLGSAKIMYAAAGYLNSFVIDSSSKVWASGYNWYGELGLGTSGYEESQNYFFQPVTFSGLGGANITSISSGYSHTLALDSLGRVWASGYNFSGQLGLGNNNDQNRFKLVTISGLAANATITSIAAGGDHSLALDSEGKIYSSGYNLYGQLGLGNSGSGTNRNSFQLVTIAKLAAGAKIVYIDADYRHSFAIDSNGKIWATGDNSKGQLGMGDTNNRNVFTLVPAF